MIPTSRRLGGVARIRDLSAITRSSGGHLESFRGDPSLLPDTYAHDALERVVDSSRSFKRLQGLSKDSVEASRSFHTSSCAPYDSTSYTAVDVPDFFVKYKQCRATSPHMGVPQNNHEEPGLMRPLMASILSGDVVATTRRLQAKIPVEHHIEEGHVVHPSGFVVPGPGHTSTSDVARAKERKRNEDKDRLVQTAAVAHCVLESDMPEQVAATTLPASHKVPFEVREADGTVKHPSGFVPPTPAHKFKCTVSSNVLWERKVSAVQQKTRRASPSRALLRAVHTTSVPKALERSRLA